MLRTDFFPALLSASKEAGSCWKRSSVADPVMVGTVGFAWPTHLSVLGEMWHEEVTLAFPYFLLTSQPLC